jgi:hypothetical protein
MIRHLLKRALQGIALVVAGLLAAVLVQFWAENQNSPFMPAGRWIGWSAYTVTLVGCAIWEFRRHLSRVTFWLALVVLVAAHALLFWFAFRFVTYWRSLWFLPITMVEYLVFAAALGALLSRKRRVH